MAKLIQCNVPATNLTKTQDFYKVLFSDLNFARSLTDEIETYHQPISADGIQLTISPRQSEVEQITCYFAVDDLDKVLSTLQQVGGVVVREPFSLPVAPEVQAHYGKEVKQHHPDIGNIAEDIGRS